jgi:hypothetical protein
LQTGLHTRSGVRHPAAVRTSRGYRRRVGRMPGALLPGRPLQETAAKRVPSIPLFPRTTILPPYDLGRSSNTVTPMLMYVLRRSGV